MESKDVQDQLNELSQIHLSTERKAAIWRDIQVRITKSEQSQKTRHRRLGLSVSLGSAAALLIGVVSVLRWDAAQHLESTATPPVQSRMSPSARVMVPLDITNLAMVTSQVGWGMDRSGSIVRTDSGGTVWSSVSPPGYDPQATHVGTYFLNEQDAWVAEKDPTGDTVRVFATQDGGRHWTERDIQVAAMWSTVQLDFSASSQIGWLMLHTPNGAKQDGLSLWKTLDGGVNWTHVLDDVQSNVSAGSPYISGEYNQMKFLGADSGYVTRTGRDGSVALFTTRNDGRSWEQAKLALPVAQGSHLEAPLFFGQHGILPMRVQAGQPFLAFWVTQDGGASWTRTPQHLPSGQYDFVNPEAGWVLQEGGSPSLYGTTDGGMHWTLVTHGLPAGVNLIDFINPKVGFAATSGSASTEYLKTVDGGVTWTRVGPWELTRS